MSDKDEYMQSLIITYTQTEKWYIVYLPSWRFFEEAERRPHFADRSVTLSVVRGRYGVTFFTSEMLNSISV